MTKRLTIRSKLAAALAVPLLALTAVVGLQLRASRNAAYDTQLQADLATSSIGPGGMVTALQNERNFESLRGLDVASPDGSVATDADATRSATDAALRTFRSLLDDLDPAAADAYLPALEDAEAALPGLRDDADTLARAPSREQAAAANALFDSYTELVGELLDANERVPLAIDDATLRTGVELLDALSRQDEVETRILHGATAASLLQDERAVFDTLRLTGLRTVDEARVRNLAVGRFARPVLDVLTHPDRALYVDVLDATAVDPTTTDVDELFAAAPANRVARLSTAQYAVSKLVSGRADAMKADAAEAQRLYLAAAIGAVLLALLMMALANRWITRPLTRLADEARDMAGDRLPAAVNAILDTPPGEDVTLPEVERIHVRGGAEVAGAVDALNAVQESALGLAVEQAVLRRNIADSFVNLGRRNQNLLARQLELITQLEAEESDAESLEQLFRLDHLATRMRRNAESLLVLAGQEPARQWTGPVPISDVVRAALGEVEHFARVRLCEVEATTVAGTAVADLSHILAELLENALSFSPPDATVDVHAHVREDGYMITIVDAGVGMGEEDQERANQRLRAAESFTIAPSRYLGHYVVANLAARHGIDVRVHPAPTAGLAATVVLPPALLADWTPVVAPAESEIEEITPPAFVLAPLPELAPPPILAPVFDAPVAEVTAAEFEAPAIEAFVVEEPVVEDPVAEEFPEPVPQPVVPQPVIEEPAVSEAVVDAPVAEVPHASLGIFATMLHAHARVPQPEPVPEATPDEEPALARFPETAAEPQPEPEPELEPAPELEAQAALYAVPVEDDLLPRLPRRMGRRGRDAEPSAPARPVVSAPAATRPPEPTPAEQAGAATTARAVASDAPPEPPAPSPASESQPSETEQSLRSYELFAAFRAATDQGRADAARGPSDRGTP